MSDDATLAAVHGFLGAIWFDGDTARFEDWVSPRVVLHHMGAGETGPVGMRGYLRHHFEILRAFPDVQADVDDTVTSGDRAAVRFRLTGTHRADLPGLPATGRRVEVPGLWVFRVRDGRIVEVWDYLDRYAMLRQLGLLPPLAETGGVI